MRGWDVKAMVTLCVTGDDSMMFQMDGVCVAGLQSSSCGIPWLPIVTRGKPEEEVNDLRRGLNGETNPQEDFDIFWPEKWEKSGIILHDGELEIDALITGALRSDYQRTRLDRMCSSLGIKSFSPLWHHDPSEHMRRFPMEGFEVRLSSISADGLGEEWIGRELTGEAVEELIRTSEKFRFNADGEGGEYETLVLSAPHMKDSINLRGEKHWRKGRGSWKLISGYLSSNR